MRRERELKRRADRAKRTTILSLLLAFSSCSTLRNVFPSGAKDDAQQPPIRNPFGTYYNEANGSNQNMVLRTRKGDRSVEVELPSADQDYTNFVVPLSPAFKDGRGPASSDGAIDDRYQGRSPTLSDREITSGFGRSVAGPAEDGKRQDVESQMGLVPSEDETPEQTTSYLAGIDHIKQLYNLGRYEAALLETDEMVKTYPTAPKLYEMRGTLLDRLGRTEMAVHAWNQSLRFNPNNPILKRFLERRHALATQPAATPDRAPAAEQEPATEADQ